MKNKKNSKKRKEKSKIKKESKEKREINLSEIEEKIKPSDEENEEGFNENNENFFEEPIRQIPLSAETRAPVLERIIQRDTPAPVIETNQERTEETGNQRRIDYSPVSNQPNYGFERRQEREEKKYESSFTPPVLSRREISPREMRQDFLNSEERQIWRNRNNDSESNEIELIEEERKLPFEEQQKKYKRFRA